MPNPIILVVAVLLSGLIVGGASTYYFTTPIAPSNKAALMQKFTVSSNVPNAQITAIHSVYQGDYLLNMSNALFNIGMWTLFIDAKIGEETLEGYRLVTFDLPDARSGKYELSGWVISDASQFILKYGDTPLYGSLSPSTSVTFQLSINEQTLELESSTVLPLRR